MFDLIKKLLKASPDAPGQSGQDQERRVRVAACVLLLEAAHADYECTDAELEHVLDTMKDRFAISGEYARELIELAREERKHQVDLFAFTRQVNDSFSRAEKLEILEAVWRIIHADGKLSKYEDHYVRKLTGLLRLYHEDMIETKLKARKSVRPKDPPVTS